MKKSNLKFYTSMLFNTLRSKHFTFYVGPGYIIWTVKLYGRIP